MNNILPTLVQRLRAIEPGQWERVAEEAGVAKSLPRKLVYGDRRNPGVLTIQPLVDYFHTQDSRAITQKTTPQEA